MHTDRVTLERVAIRPQWRPAAWAVPSIRTDALLWAAVAVATVVAALGFALRLGAYDFGRDDAVTVLAANMPLSHLLDLVAHHDANPAAYYVFMHFWPHQTEVLARLPSYLAAVLVIPATAWLASRLNVSVVAATGLAFSSPFVAYEATEVRTYALLVLFSALALLVTWDAITDRRIPWPVLPALLALSLYFHHFMAFLVLAALLALWLWAPSRRDARRAALLVSVLFAPGLIMLGFQLPAMLAMSGGGWQHLIRGPEIWKVFRTLFAFRSGSEQARWLALLVALVAGAGAVVAIRSRAGRLLMLFGAVQLFPLVPGVFVKMVAPWYVCGALVPMLLLAALALSRPRVLSLAVLVPVALGLFVIWHNDYGFDGIKPPVRAALQAVPADVPILVGRHSLAPSVALYTQGRLTFALKNPPRVDYVGLWALPPGQPLPLVPRIAVFDLCSADPVVVSGYIREQQIVYPGNLCVELERRVG